MFFVYFSHINHSIWSAKTPKQTYRDNKILFALYCRKRKIEIRKIVKKCFFFEKSISQFNKFKFRFRYSGLRQSKVFLGQIARFKPYLHQKCNP